MMDPCRALENIWTIVHTPTSKTKHRSADAHFMADFDAIREIIRSFVDAGFIGPPKDKPKDAI